MTGPRPRVAAVVLAAGRGDRMGSSGKLLATVAGVPLVARVVGAALASVARPVVLVTGYDADAIAASVPMAPSLRIVHNPDHARGLVTSLRAGVASVAREVDAVLICLADMPRLRAEHLDRVVAAYAEDFDGSVCRATFDGRPGHPVLWPARCFSAIAALPAGESGARSLLAAEGVAGRLREVEMPDDGVVADVDTPADLTEARARVGESRSQ